MRMTFSFKIPLCFGSFKIKQSKSQRGEIEAGKKEGNYWAWGQKKREKPLILEASIQLRSISSSTISICYKGYSQNYCSFYTEIFHGKVEVSDLDVHDFG